MIGMYVSTAIALVATDAAIGIIPFDPQAVPRVGEDQVPAACRAARLPGGLSRPGSGASSAGHLREVSAC